MNAIREKVVLDLEALPSNLGYKIYAWNRNHFAMRIYILQISCCYYTESSK